MLKKTESKWSLEGLSGKDLEKTLLLHMAAAKTYAKKYCYPQEADDFAGYVVEKRLKGCLSSSFRQLWVDYLRENFGDTRFRRGRIKSKAEYFRDQEFSPDAAGAMTLQPIDPENQPDHRLRKADVSLDIERFLKTLAMRERALVILGYYYGLRSCEIAYVLGITEGFVCQLFNRIGIARPK